MTVGRCRGTAFAFVYLAFRCYLSLAAVKLVDLPNDLVMDGNACRYAIIFWSFHSMNVFEFKMIYLLYKFDIYRYNLAKLDYEFAGRQPCLNKCGCTRKSKGCSLIG